MNTLKIFFVILLAVAFAAPSSERTPVTAVPKVEPTVPKKAGQCTPAFTESVIVPFGKCACNALFNDVISVNQQQFVEGDCVAFFGSKKAILNFEDPCCGFMAEDRSINTLLLETLANAIYKKCFPKFLFKVHITKH